MKKGFGVRSSGFVGDGGGAEGGDYEFAEGKERSDVEVLVGGYGGGGCVVAVGGGDSVGDGYY